MFQNLLTPIFRLAKKRRSLPFVPLTHINAANKPSANAGRRKPLMSSTPLHSVPSHTNQLSS